MPCKIKNIQLFMLCVFWLNLQIDGWAAESMPGISIGILLEQVVKSSKSIPPHCYDYESESYLKISRSESIDPLRALLANEPAIKEFGRVFVNGNQVDLLRKQKTTPDRRTHALFEERQIWDGKRYWQRQQMLMPLLEPTYILSEDRTLSATVVSDWANGSFLEGRLNGGNGPSWIDQVITSRATSLSDKAEILDGFQCRIITIKSRQGILRFWVDEKNGASLRKMTADIIPAQLSLRDRLISSGRQKEPKKIEYCVKDVKIEKIGNLYFPVEGTLICKTVFEDGKVYTHLMHARRANIQLKPDFVRLGAFIPDFPSGAVLNDVKFHLRYQLINGVPKVYTDPQLIDRIRKTVGELHSLTRNTSVKSCDAVSDNVIATSGAHSIQSMSAPLKTADTSDPVSVRCGLYTLFAGLEFLGKTVDPAKLLKPEYITEPNGSSFSDLVKAARSLGFAVMPISRLSTGGLRKSPYPLILHVKADESSKKYDHYELFLGTKNGQAWLYDVLGLPRLEPFQTLVARWDGTALSLSTPVRNKFLLMLFDVYPLIILGIAGLLASIIFYKFAHRYSMVPQNFSLHQCFRLTLSECVYIGGVTILCSLIWHFAISEGLLRNVQGVDSIRRSHMGDFVSIANIDEMKQIVQGQEQSVIIDARAPLSYYKGHIEKALNVHPMLTRDQRIHAMSGISKDARVIVYCASESCNIAKKVIASLSSDGFMRLALFKGGWEKWQEENQ